MILLLSVFFVPLIASWILFYFHNDFHLGTTNHGTLVNPAQPSEDLALANSTTKQWQIVYVPKGCGDEKRMYLLHQLRLVLGKDSHRVTLTVVADQSCAAEDAHDFRKVIFSDAQYQNLQKSLASNETSTDKIYLMDPIGNIFMYYGSNTDPMNILRDLQKVLEVSQIG